MPRFTGQNKKRRDPRYFLNEEVKSDKQLQELLNDLGSSLRRLKVYTSSTFYPSVMYRVLRSGNMDGTPGNEDEGLDMALEYLASKLERKGADTVGIPVDNLRSSFPEFVERLERIKQDMDPRVTPNFEPTPFGGKDKRAFTTEGMLSRMMSDSGAEVGDELVIDGYDVEVTDVIRPGQAIEVAFLDTKDGLDQATAVWNGSEWELARG